MMISFKTQIIIGTLLPHISIHATGFSLPNAALLDVSPTIYSPTALLNNRRTRRPTLGSIRNPNHSWTSIRGGSSSDGYSSDEDSTELNAGKTIDVEYESSNIRDDDGDDDPIIPTGEISHIGKPYGLPSILWLSLAMDSLISKKKRMILFGSASNGAVSASNLAPSVALASGFVFSAGIAFLLSTESFFGKKSDAGFRSVVFGRLSLSLALFGLLNVAGHATPHAYFGIAAAVIHSHNALVSVNGWMKCAKTFGKDGVSMFGETMRGCKSTVESLLFRGVFWKRSGKWGVSAGYLLGAYATAAKAGFALVHASSPIMQKVTLESASSYGLQWALIARLVLASGVCLVLKEAADRDRMDDASIVLLNGLSSLSSMAVAVSLFLTSYFSAASVSASGAALASFAIFSGYNCFANYK